MAQQKKKQIGRIERKLFGGIPVCQSESDYIGFPVKLSRAGAFGGCRVQTDESVVGESVSHVIHTQKYFYMCFLLSDEDRCLTFHFARAQMMYAFSSRRCTAEEKFDYQPNRTGSNPRSLY